MTDVRFPAADSGKARSIRAAPTVGKVDSELREILKERSESSFRKYLRLNVGKEGVAALVAYEWNTALLGSIPGAAGLFLRQKLGRRMWGSCGTGVAIGRNVTVRHPHRIVLGNDVVIDDNCVLDGKGEADTTLVIGDGASIGRNTVLSCKGGTIRLGERVNISVNCTLISESELTIGSKVLIAGHCYLIAGGNHGIDRTDIPILEQPLLHKGGVHVGDNAWLGASVTVLDGVTIGRDSVVAAGAVVHRPLPDFAVGGGVPARVLRMRNAPAGEERSG
jgi:acetyltransferase-like isoleucine patch superfamily enzyme